MSRARAEPSLPLGSRSRNAVFDIQPPASRSTKLRARFRLWFSSNPFRSGTLGLSSDLLRPISVLGPDRTLLDQIL